MFLNFDAMPPPCGGRPGIRRPCGRRERCHLDMVPPERCSVVMVPLLRHGSTGHGIWCRLRPARFLAARLRSAFGGPALRGGGTQSLQGTQSRRGSNPGGVAIPAGRAIPPGHAVISGMRSFWACGPFGHAISQVRNLLKSASGGGTAGPIGPAGTVPPIGGTVPGGTGNGAAQWGGTVSGAAQRGGAKPPGKGQAQNRRRPCCPPARSGRRERCRPIGRHGVWCRAIARHGVWCRRTWCRQSAARSTVPAKAGAVPGGTGNGACNCRHGMVPAKGGTEYGAGQLPGTVPGGAVLGR